MKLSQSGKMKFTSYEASELDVRIYGDAAVVIGRGRCSGSFDGEDFTSGDRFTDGFIRQDGKWRTSRTTPQRSSSHGVKRIGKLPLASAGT